MSGPYVAAVPGVGVIGRKSEPDGVEQVLAKQKLAGGISPDDFDRLQAHLAVLFGKYAEQQVNAALASAKRSSRANQTRSPVRAETPGGSPVADDDDDLDYDSDDYDDLQDSLDELRGQDPQLDKALDVVAAYLKAKSKAAVQAEARQRQLAGVLPYLWAADGRAERFVSRSGRPRRALKGDFENPPIERVLAGELG